MSFLIKALCEAAVMECVVCPSALFLEVNALCVYSFLYLTGCRRWGSTLSWHCMAHESITPNVLYPPPYAKSNLFGASFTLVKSHINVLYAHLVNLVTCTCDTEIFSFLLSMFFVNVVCPSSKAQIAHTLNNSQASFHVFPMKTYHRWNKQLNKSLRSQFVC